MALASLSEPSLGKGGKGLLVCSGRCWRGVPSATHLQCPPAPSLHHRGLRVFSINMLDMFVVSKNTKKKNEHTKSCLKSRSFLKEF